MSKRIFVANWKMQLSFKQTLMFAQEHHDELITLTQNNSIVLCPSFPALHDLALMLENTGVAIGAQSVSRHISGPYTGQVSAQSLAEAGCSYCIIGHSERRQHAHETNIDITHKIKELLKQRLIPIICIGETKEQHEQKMTHQALQAQLLPALDAIREYNHTANNYIIAYEPTWAIGTDITPTTEELAAIFAWLSTQCAEHTDVPFQLLYGGSANPNNAHAILAVPHVNGLLIGSASLDFEQFKTIVAE